MRHLTHRSNAHPAQIGRQEARRAQEISRKIIEGQKVHLSGRSMWRGYWYGKGAIAKWNRAEQVLTGMKWSYYTGRHIQIAQISLLEAHHAAAGPALGHAAAEKKDGDGNQTGMILREGHARISADCGAQEAPMDAHGARETSRIDARLSAPDAGRTHIYDSKDAAGAGPDGEKHASHAHNPAHAPPGNCPAATSEAPCPNAGTSAAFIPAPAGNSAPEDIGGPVNMDGPVIQAGSGLSAAACPAKSPRGCVPPEPISAPGVFLALSEALSSAIGGIIRHTGIRIQQSGKKHADALRDGAGSIAFLAPRPVSANPTNMIYTPSSAPDAPACGYQHGQGAYESRDFGSGLAHRPAVHVGTTRRKSIQLKVARADALPPQ